MAGVINNINILRRRTQSKEQQNHKSHYDDDQIHARVFRSLPGEGLIQNHPQQYIHNAPSTT